MIESIGYVVGVQRISDYQNIVATADVPLLLPGIGPQGGEMTTTEKKFVCRSGMSLFPLQRAITLLGTKNQALDEVASWDDYRKLLRENIKKVIKIFSDLSSEKFAGS